MAEGWNGPLEKIDEFRWKIPKSFMPGMRVPGIIFADQNIIDAIKKDKSPQQVANAAHLPGIVYGAMAMPDMHLGYGLPIGGVAATDIEEGGVITPGGVGYDINCGVRIIRTNISEFDIAGKVKDLVSFLFQRIPAGVGSTGNMRLSPKEYRQLLVMGAGWAVKKGFGLKEDLDFCEEGGAMEGAEPSAVSKRAYERGRTQPGTLGSGNHFLEIQAVDEVYDEASAGVFGLSKGSVTVMIHTGSRGFGHQVCDEYARDMVRLLPKFKIDLPDRQLACAPVGSNEGKRYIAAMKCAANYAWANRQILTHLVREAFEEFFREGTGSLGMRLVYDVAHNIAKFERHEIGGKRKLLCVHRKGATRAFPPGHDDLPEVYKTTGQPVIVPGDMGSYSYVLAGVGGGKEAFYSSCHGAGRLLSRKAAINATRGRSLAMELEKKGIFVRAVGRSTLSEEAPQAYKDVRDVVRVIDNAGFSRKVVRLRPLGVIKG